MSDEILTEEVRRLISRETARGIVASDTDLSPEDREELRSALTNLFERVLNEPTFKIIWDKGQALATKILKKSECSGYELVGKLATLLFEYGCEAIPDIAQSGDKPMMILKALMYAISLFIAIMVVVGLKLLAPTGAFVFEVAKGAWRAIRAVIEFTWNIMLTAVKSPASWGVVTAAGARIAVGNALVGGLVVAVGVMGMAYTFCHRGPIVEHPPAP